MPQQSSRNICLWGLPDLHLSCLAIMLQERLRDSNEGPKLSWIVDESDHSKGLVQVQIQTWMVVGIPNGDLSRRRAEHKVVNFSLKSSNIRSLCLAGLPSQR